jgi:hypothetical protein
MFLVRTILEYHRFLSRWSAPFVVFVILHSAGDTMFDPKARGCFANMECVPSSEERDSRLALKVPGILTGLVTHREHDVVLAA